MFLPTARGSTGRSFFSSTSDSRTARRASARSCSALSLPAKTLPEGRLPNSPARNLTRTMRVTASSMRAIGMSPFSTWAMVLAMKAFQASGTMIMSMPALIAWAQLSSRQPGTSPMPFQSLTTKPSKRILVFRTSVSKARLPCILP